ncbi:MAG: LAGLIDADG family homing endonuclease [Patescibacteria group bacterium]|nr:LAGLIDADG family homing endonuclease [Patescibacteria group bacterium]
MFNANYIIGLVDGEGSFTVYINDGKNLDKKRRVRIEPKFYLKLIEEDKRILYQLKKYFCCGNVYLQKDKRPNHKTCYRYEVSKRDDLINIIIPFFAKNKLLFSSKKRDFMIFCQIIEEIKKGKHLTKSGLEKLYKLKQNMH